MSGRKILVVVDPTAREKQPVVERAAWLAEVSGAELELFACDYDADIDAGRVAMVEIPGPGTREHLLLRHRRTLEELAEPLRARGLHVTVDVAWDSPIAEAIMKRAAAVRAWLVAKDTHHHSLIERTLLTNEDWELIRECPVPLLLVKPREIAVNPTVLAAVDPLHIHDKPAALDSAIYEFAASLAANATGVLHLVHASAPPMGVQLPPAAQALIAAEHRKALATFVERHPLASQNVHVLDGLPHECLQHAAKSLGADFLVMGAVARRGIKKLVIGSTAVRVLDRLPCDLVIIKPAELIVSSPRKETP
jgi:universal stress protein E